MDWALERVRDKDPYKDPRKDSSKDSRTGRTDWDHTADMADSKWARKDSQHREPVVYPSARDRDTAACSSQDKNVEEEVAGLGMPD